MFAVAWLLIAGNRTSDSRAAANATEMPATMSGTMPGASAGLVQRSIRFNTHLNRDAPWSGDFNGNDVHPFIEALLTIPRFYGIRDTISTVADKNSTDEVRYLAARGVHFDLVTSQDLTAAAMEKYVTSYPKGSVSSIEGPNECNISKDPDCFGRVGWPAWGTNDRAFSLGDLCTAYRDTRTSAAVANPYDYIASSIAGRTVSTAGPVLGDLTSCVTLGNIHHYAQSAWPEGGSSSNPRGESDVARNMGWARPISGDLPVSATETAEVRCCTVTYGVPEAIGGRNAPRKILFEWLMGVKSVYIYALLESARNESFEAVDGSTYKAWPQYKALAGLSELLYDPHPLGGNCVVHAAVTGPGVSIMTPAAQGISVFNVCKSTGEEDIFLWQAVPNYAGTTALGGFVDVPSVNVSVTLSTKPSTVNFYAQDPATGVFSEAPSVPDLAALPVTDRVEMIQLGGPKTIPLAIPTDMP
ncbi:MAG: hypothetical protein M3R53_01430 [Candidatus Eremiobacteraeota bacterium]|nr:hypothetical protein [Candidatus Eremiobacteraeota bacterium]